MKKISLTLILLTSLSLAVNAQTTSTPKKATPQTTTAKTSDTTSKTPPISDTKATKQASPKQTAKPTDTKLIKPIPIPPKNQEVTLTGMVEISAFKKNQPQTYSIWTQLPILKEESTEEALKTTNQMVKVKGELIEKNGQYVLKIKSVTPVEEAE